MGIGSIEVNSIIYSNTLNPFSATNGSLVAITTIQTVINNNTSSRTIIKKNVAIIFTVLLFVVVILVFILSSLPMHSNNT